MANERTKKTPELGFDDLTLDNLPRYRSRILYSERIFHPNLRSDAPDLREVVGSKGAIGKIALLGDRYIGNALGFSPTQEQIERMELLDVEEDFTNIYLSNFVINSRFQGQGFGTGLLQEFMRECKNKSYAILEGHFKDGASLYIAKRLGGIETDVYPDWFETGDRYVHCKLEL